MAEGSLADMSLAELWQLFPIELRAWDSRWPVWYEEEKGTLLGVLGPDAAEVHHIGSTAVPGIWAKPIIDILMIVPAADRLVPAETRLEANGWTCMSKHSERISLNKGYTADGFAERVFHLHLRLAGDADELYFRDLLRNRPDIARQYEQLKLGLWKRYEHNRDGYTEAKSEFVERCTRQAKRQAPPRR